MLRFRSYGATVLTCALLGLASTSGMNCGGPDPELPPPSSDTISFAKQIQPIFNTNCIVCHVQGGFADLSGIALRLIDGESFNGLVNQPSVQRGDLTLVVPGDSGSSLLFNKIRTSSPPVGSRMPLLAGSLPASDIALIRDWIDQGALNN